MDGNLLIAKLLFIYAAAMIDGGNPDFYFFFNKTN
jgi:hypothetical protein